MSIAPRIDPKWAMFRKLLVGDKTSEVASCASVQDAYGQYLQALKLSAIDQAEMEKLKDAYRIAVRALKDFVRTANNDWKMKKRGNPNLARTSWDKDYGDGGFSPERKQLQDAVTRTHGDWQAKARRHPELFRIFGATVAPDSDPANAVPLPTTDDELRKRC